MRLTKRPRPYGDIASQGSDTNIVKLQGNETDRLAKMYAHRLTLATLTDLLLWHYGNEDKPKIAGEKAGFDEGTASESIMN
ncbi:hypothetical protein PoB_000246500 [Plakobranchus ocellatus]|uniref:Uncharacterized protein n=1 Tax=Plakobranchus ocellatus TaxID=259542 RepID=A0AAV3XZ80_9GAST|nr:hypothetical protein PoB_000246500 [Plakobranchus ocellatus]